ncbi:uncharacterized protein LOC124413067 [Diprion similis]|uniref:uncharacterized protein LOC124413067 n=1 Tax=Diprion similis TaxID=362088 RepID=UPI001EF95767|nr:uncharacterized protein LOC124413067 [Diprion similis]
MIGKCSALIVFLTLIVVAHGAPRKPRRATLPSWHHPCGENHHTTTEENMVDDCETGLRSGLQVLTSSNAFTLDNYVTSKYDQLYSQVSSLPEHQYKQNWVPGKKDVKMVMDLVKANPKTIAEHLPKLHTDLQKFVVGLEELVEDETREEVHNVLVKTRDSLMVDLCEVEIFLSSMCLKVPERVSEDIMTGPDKDPVGETKRLVRDWGILYRYGDYLSAWEKVLH